MAMATTLLNDVPGPRLSRRPVIFWSDRFRHPVVSTPTHYTEFGGAYITLSRTRDVKM